MTYLGLKYVGPTEIQCPEQCDVPAGVTLTECPMPRHNWSDCLVCPNDCGLAFLIHSHVAASDTGGGGSGG